MQPLAYSLCSAVDKYFKLPNFCSCAHESFGGKLACSVGIGGASIGASAWFLPCGSPASFGYEAHATVYGMGYKIGQKWTAGFSLKMAIPYASVSLGPATLGAQAELNGAVNGGVIRATFAIGFCAKAGPFGGCNPSIPFAPLSADCDCHRIVGLQQLLQKTLICSTSRQLIPCPPLSRLRCAAV